MIARRGGRRSVREWMPGGTRFPNRATVLQNVTESGPGGWESKGALFDNLVGRMKQTGPRGFRAVLWHQGESDANQKDASRTLAGALYAKYLEQIIRDSRRETGREAPKARVAVEAEETGTPASEE